MKKSVLIFIFLALSLIPLASAAANETDDAKVSRAYQCLESAISNRTSAQLSLEEATFSILALGANAKAEQKLDAEKRSVSSNATCWPQAGCRLKETAQAILAYDLIGKNTDQAENFLLSKSVPATGLQWFLEIYIQNQETATCVLRYQGNERSVSIGEDMRISGDAGSCLSPNADGYWLGISPSCLTQTFEISCNKDFITTLLYQKSGSDTVYVSPTATSAASSGTTTESIHSRCFALANECDYEGTLWAALALDETEHDMANYIPYLIAFAPDNERFLPDAFTYKLSTSQDSYSSLIQSQKNAQFWEAPSTAYNKFYDTALTLLALQGKSISENDNAKRYLLNIQDASGCWNNKNLRDTAFLLYAGWSRLTRFPGTPSGSVENCLSVNSGYACVSSDLVCRTADGNPLPQFACSGSLKCCSVAPQRELCSTLNGEICASNEQCSGTERESADGSCCIERYELTAPVQDACAQSLGVCSLSCVPDTETEGSEQCPLSGDVCCVSKSEESSGGSNWLVWTIILIILIALVALAIAYRKKLQLLFFKSRRGGVSSTPLSTTRHPPFPPASFPSSMPMRPRPAISSRQASPLDKEMEETLRKLREISK